LVSAARRRYVLYEKLRPAGSNPQPLAPEANDMLGDMTVVAILLPLPALFP